MTVEPAMVASTTKARKLSEELAALQLRAGERAVTLRELIYVLRGRAYLLLIILLSLPFMQPVPLPGLSTPLGLAIVFISLRLSLGQRPWLPKKIQRVQLPAGFFGKLIKFTEKLVRLTEAVLRPRLLIVTSRPLFNQLHAIVIFVCAVVLLLPLPIPFSNVMPAWAIFLMACGLIERDGVVILAAYVALAVASLYFIFLGEMAHQGFGAMMEWWRNR